MAPPLVFLPGAGGSESFWRPVADRLVDDRTDLADRLATIRAPTLLLGSDADPISPPAVARFLAERIAGTRIATVAGGAHSFANERPDEVASIIRSHIRREPGTGPAARARRRDYS